MSDQDLLHDALSRMPHSGPMRLIETIESITETRINCRATDHRASCYPLRLNGKLSRVALVELGAQAAAAHCSIHGIGSHHIGLLLTIQNTNIDNVVSLASRLRIEALRLDQSDMSARYEFAVLSKTGTVVSGELLLQMQEVS